MNPLDTEGCLHWQECARRVAQGIRQRVLAYTVANNGGYLSQACSSAEILATLYIRVMRLGPSQAPLVPGPFDGVPGPGNPGYRSGAAYNGPRRPDLDRFFLSPAHYALALYAALVETRRMLPDGLSQFNRDGSSVEMIGAEHSPGMEVPNGSLGQTISQAGGVALARKRRGEPGRTWVFMSDGEFQSGQTWEALQCLAFYKLDCVAIYVDVNGQQCDGKVESVMRIDPLATRLQGFGARVFEVDGHDVDALAAPAELRPNGAPLVVLCHTDPCRGVGLLEERRPRLHYVRFRDSVERDAYAALLPDLQQAGLTKIG